MNVLYLCPLENCFRVHCLGLAWVVLVGFDPTDVFTPPKAPLPQALKRVICSKYQFKRKFSLYCTYIIIIQDFKAGYQGAMRLLATKFIFSSSYQAVNGLSYQPEL